jgi:hypothetical protein
MKTESNILGIDIGRVIIHGDGPDTSFVGAGTNDEALRAPAMDGALEAIRRLTLRVGGHRVFLVSKCGPKVERRSLLWLEHHDFYGATGVPRENVRFCRDRAHKAPIARKLGVSLFVDDRIDVLVAMEGVVPHRFLFGAATSPRPGIVAAPNWAVVEAAITRALDGAVTGIRESAPGPVR